MRSHLLFARCLALSWVPFFWSLYQSTASAAIAQLSIVAEPGISEKIAPSKSVDPVDAAVEQPFEQPSEPSRSSLPRENPTYAAPKRTLKRTADAPDLDSFASSETLSRNSLGPDEAAEAKLEAKNSLGPAPLLAEFLETSVEETDQPEFSPRADIASEPLESEDERSPDVNVSPTAPRDPELGVIQVSDPRQDPELGLIQLRNPLQDPELGILELRQISPPLPPRPYLFVSSYITASSSDNVFLVEDPVQGRFGDNFIRPGISLTAFPSVGPNTNLLASVETNFLRYEKQSDSSYDELRFRAGVRHRFTERTYGLLTFNSQLLFDEGFKDQFFTNNGVELTLGRRDVLTPQLTLDSYYQGQLYFSDPSEFSNVLNSVGAYLGYRINSQWDTGLSYRLTVSDFTRQSRHETYQRITGLLRYSITPSVRVSVFGGLSYGRSSEDNITFDDSFFGISFDATVQIF